MNYAQISKETISYLYKSYEKLKESPLNQSLRVLIELRVSQLNHCNYCCNLHTKEAQALSINELKIKELSQWPKSEHFSAAEKEALSWAEAITNLKSEYTIETTNLACYFNEREIVDITACVAIMNALNRMTRLSTKTSCEI
jgi:AhpD family alkylhydroperoxidase